MEKKLNVLIIEDLPSDAELAKRETSKVIPNAKFKVVDNENDYLEAINSYKPNLIISDYQMPKFDGFSALLLRNSMLPDVPFVMLTGSVNEEVAVKCVKNGADDYVIKEHIKRLGQALLNALDKKQSERQHRIIEEQLKLVSAAVEQSPVSIVITDKAGDIVYVNPTFEKLTGYSYMETIGKNPRFLKGGTTQEVYENLWNTIRSGKQWTGEFNNKRKDGTMFWESASISPVRNAKNEITHYLAVKEDITEKRAMIRELMNREERYRTLTHNLSVGIYRNGAGPDGKFIEGNPALLKIFGLRSKKEFDLYKVSYFYPDPEERIKVEKKLDEQGFLLEEEIRLRRKDGELFYAMVSNTAVKDENGKSIYYDGIIEDITEKKNIQDSIIKQRNAMEELNNQLITTEEESKRRLATELHDGLGQSLAIVKIKLSELSMKLTLDENEIYREVLENLQNAINESRSLTYELSPPMLVELGLIPTIEWKIDEIKKQNDIKAVLIDNTDGFVLDDKYQLSLYRTISEVMQNILKHSQASIVRVTFTVDDENYLVEIFDDGIGFEYEKVKTEALKNKKFGLFSVVERVKYLKGNFKIDSNSGIGTTVTINFPKSIL